METKMDKVLAVVGVAVVGGMLFGMLFGMLVGMVFKSSSTSGKG